MTKRADNNVARSRNKIFALVLSRRDRARSRWRSSRFFFFVPPNREQGDGGSVRPTMIGGARSTKSPRDQAYIYFACFEGSAAGGYRERKRMRENGEKGRREEGQEDGRKEGLRASQQCGIWRVLVPSNSTRCSSAAGCIISRFSHEAARTELPGCCFPFLLVPLSIPCSLGNAPLRPRMLPLVPFFSFVLQQGFLWYPLVIPLCRSRYKTRIFGDRALGVPTIKPQFSFRVRSKCSLEILTNVRSNL